jgi:hypothetical protein
MIMDTFTLMCAGSDAGTLVLPITPGTLGVDVLYVGRVLDASGNTAIGPVTGNYSGWTNSANLSMNNDDDDHSDELWQVLVRLPGHRPGG